MATETPTENPPNKAPLSTVVNRFLQSLPTPVSDTEIQKRESDEAARSKKARISDLLAQCCIGPRERAAIDAGFESTYLPWTKRMEQIRSKVGTGCVLVLLGTRGTGKTIAGAIAVHESCQRQERAVYTSAVSFYIDLRGSYSDGATETERQILNRYISPKLLVIDEAHERGDTPWVDRMLTYLVDQRYQSMKDTILIANQTPEEFAASVGPSITDRAREGGGILMYQWESFRGAKK